MSCNSLLAQDPVFELSFENSFNGADGETPLSNSGPTFRPGVRGLAALFGIDDVVTYESAGNIDSQNGDNRFSLSHQNWNGKRFSDPMSFLVWDSLPDDNGGGLLFSKDGANNLRQVFNRFSQDGQNRNWNRH